MHGPWRLGTCLIDCATTNRLAAALRRSLTLVRVARPSVVHSSVREDITMRACGALFVWAGVLTATCVAQDATKWVNPKYEKLKVLEPIIGTWTFVRTYPGSEAKSEVQTTYSWSPSKGMITSTSRTRHAADGDLGKAQEWIEGGPFIFFVWNEKTNRIESHGLYTLAGNAGVYAVTCRDDGSFESSPTHENFDTVLSKDVMTIKGNEMRIKSTNRRDPSGETLEDSEQVSTRIPPPKK